jgi:hydroxymethylpyrimidine/phosphomethylpyrimidine kinase
MIPVALTVAGSDSSGGAGIQADLKTFAAFGVFGASAITALTAQNTLGVRAIANLEPEFIGAQIDAVCDDLEVSAVKTGMLSNAAAIEKVAVHVRAQRLANLIVDPVIVAASGDRLLEHDAITMLKYALFPAATLITPNIREAEILAGCAVRTADDMREAARRLVTMGAHSVLVTGGALEGDAVDVFFDGRTMRDFRAPRVAVGRAHGAGCTLSAAIAASMARGQNLEDAIALAKRYVTHALETAPEIGHGSRPLNHLVGSFPTDVVTPR